MFDYHPTSWVNACQISYLENRSKTCQNCHSRIHGQPRFVLHEGIAAGSLNSDFNSATPQMQPWQSYLGNTAEVLDLLLKRMKSDWEGLASKARKPWNQAQIEPWNSIDLNDFPNIHKIFVKQMRFGKHASQKPRS